MSDNEIRMSAELRGGCVHHRKRWSGDTHADLGGSVNEAGTEALMSAAADTIDRLTAQRDFARKEAQFLRSHRPIARRLSELEAELIQARAERDAAVEASTRLLTERKP